MSVDDKAYTAAIRAFLASAGKRKDGPKTVCGLDMAAAIEAYEAAKAKDQPDESFQSDIEQIKKAVRLAYVYFGDSLNKTHQQVYAEIEKAHLALTVFNSIPMRESVTLPYDRNDLFKRLCKLGTPINCLIGAARSAMGTNGNFHQLNKAWATGLVEHADKAKEAWDGIVAIFDDEQGSQL